MMILFYPADLQLFQLIFECLKCRQVLTSFQINEIFQFKPVLEVFAMLLIESLLIKFEGNVFIFVGLCLWNQSVRKKEMNHFQGAIYHACANRGFYLINKLAHGR